MQRKTLALISGLVLVTVVLFIIALRTNQQANQTANQPSQAVAVPTEASPAHSVLSLAPNPILVRPGQSGSVDVVIDTSDNEVTAVQLEIGYDPTVLSNVQVTAGQLFQNPVVLINKNDAQKGEYTYAFGITPNRPTIKGTGAVAKITFTTRNVPGKHAELTLKPSTLITARGVRNSVLKNATGATIVVNATGTGTNTRPATGNTTTNTTAPTAAIAQ